MLTEAEAREKWCPFARVGTYGRPSWFKRLVQFPLNRLQGSGLASYPKASVCIASECMAWRWDMDPDSDNTNGEVGYCGLAGKP